MATGRTVFKWMKLQIGDTSNVLRDIFIDELSVVGLKYQEMDLTAWQDAVMGALPNQPECPIEFGGPFSNLAAQAASGTGAAPAESGAHTVLNPLNGGSTPRTLGVYQGIRGYWATGDPVFGLAQSATSGFIITSYQVDFKTMRFKAKAQVYPGSSAPAWGTAVLS